VNREAPCPVCENDQWELLRKQTFERASGEADGYLRARIGVLLDVWHAGTDRATIAWSVCRACGFVGYLPRPTAQNVAEKYEALANGQLAPAKRLPAMPFDPATWDKGDAAGAHRRRAAALFDLLSEWVVPGSSILDFGGGTGRLMRDFVIAGHRCEVLDYGTRAPLSGVAYAGATFADLPPGPGYDLAVCSHVLEHVANPTEDLRNLRSILKKDGLLYIEVPCEVWKGGPVPREPVTHINYFSTGPVRTLLEKAGLDVIGCHYAPYITYDGGAGLAVKALARVAKPSARPVLGGSEPVKALIAGSLKPILRDWQPGRFSRSG
jgi:SAM-dependent methyltransferase